MSANVKRSNEISTNSRRSSLLFSLLIAARFKLFSQMKKSALVGVSANTIDAPTLPVFAPFTLVHAHSCSFLFTRSRWFESTCFKRVYAIPYPRTAEVHEIHSRFTSDWHYDTRVRNASDIRPERFMPLVNRDVRVMIKQIYYAHK